MKVGWGFGRASVVSVMLAAGVVSTAAQPSAPMSVPPPGLAATAAIPMLRDVGIDQKLDSPIPLSTPFVDETGADVTLARYFGSRPVILVLAYYECPMLCTQVINAAASSMVALTFDAGRDFDVLVVSFDPGETPALAAGKRDAFLRRYGRPASASGIHFLTGRQASIDALTKAVGFRYAYDAKIDQFAHPAVITILTNQGHVSRYLFGIEFAPRDLKFALMEASAGKIGTVVDQAMLFCYHYDPETGSYGFAIMTTVRVAGLLTLVLLGAFIVVNLRRDRRQDKAVTSTATVIRQMTLPFPLFPPSASSVATEMDLLYLFIAAISAFFVVLVAVLVLIFAVKFRRRHPAEVGADIHGSLVLELTWTFIPFVLAMIMFFWGADLFFRLARPPVDSMEIFAVGKQWMWKVQHPTGVREINELHVPTGRNIRLTLGSEDVIHDFSIPAFRVKMDAVPGKLTTMWFKAEVPGTYHIFCAEYCGTKHSGMIGQVTVLTPQDYELWLAGGTGGSSLPPAQAGEKLFTGPNFGCSTCHKPDGKGPGPSLIGVYGSQVELTDGRKVPADDNYLRESIMVSTAKVVKGYQPIMPPFQGLVGEEQLMQLIAYVKTLKAPDAPAH